MTSKMFLLSRRDFVRSVGLGVGAFAASSLLPRVSFAGWDAVRDILVRIKPPVFPKRDFDITKFGAVGDGVKNCNDALK
jgi:hypothetical protein